VNKNEEKGGKKDVMTGMTRPTMTGIPTQQPLAIFLLKN